MKKRPDGVNSSSKLDPPIEIGHSNHHHIDTGIDQPFPPPPTLHNSKNSKKANVFSKSFKKFSKGSSIFTHQSSSTEFLPSINQNIDEESSTTSRSSPKTSTYSGSQNDFQAIGYDATSDSKEPIHVMYLPDRSASQQSVPQLLSPRQVSIGSQSSEQRERSQSQSQSSYHSHHQLHNFSNHDFSEPQIPNNDDNNGYANSVTSSGHSINSLDPKAKYQNDSLNQNTPGLAEIGLGLAGFGLSNDDIAPPPPLKDHQTPKDKPSSGTPLHTIYQNEPTSIKSPPSLSAPPASTSVNQYSEQNPPPVPPHSPSLVPPPNISKGFSLSPKKARSKSSSSKRNVSPVQFTTTVSPKQTTHSSSANSLVSYSAVASQLNQMPKPHIVDELFANLLSTRIFPDQSFKNITTKRKWELLLSENENNSDFDLPKFNNDSYYFGSPNNIHSPNGSGVPKVTESLNELLDDGHGSSMKSSSSYSSTITSPTKSKQFSSIKNLSRRVGQSNDNSSSSTLITNNSQSSTNNNSIKKNSFEDQNSIRNKKKSSESGPLDNESNHGSGSQNISSLYKKSKLKEGSPEWYVSRIMSNKLTLKEYKKLEKRLSESKYALWATKFNQSQGETALSVILSRINKKSIKSNEEFDKEHVIVKCLKNILNLERFDEIEEDAKASKDSRFSSSIGVKHRDQVIKSIIFSLISPKLSTRILVTEVLIFLSYYRGANFLPQILDSMVAVQDFTRDFVRFQPWLGAFESFLDQYFTNDVRAGDSNFKNYSLTTLLLINSIMEGTSQIKKRISLRREFNDSRLLKVFDKIRVINDDRINEEIEKYEAFAEEDYTEFFNLGNQFKQNDNESFDVVSLDDLYGDLKRSFNDNQTEEDKDDNDDVHLKSIFQKFLMLKDSGRSDKEINKLLLLIDSVMQHIVAESTMIGSDAVSVLNSSIQRLMDRMTTDDTARRAVLETRELTRTVKVLEEEKKQLELEASFGLNQTVANLKKENGLSAIKIAALEKQIDSLQMKIKYLTEERQKWIKFASSNKNNASSIQDSPSSPPYRANSVRHNSIVSELETVYSTKSGRSNNDKITIDLSKDDFVNSDDISIISENYPSRSKSVRSKYSYTAPKSSDSETFDNKVKEDVDESTTKNTESEKLDEASSTPAQPAVPPPPPPPVPFFLTAKASERSANVASGAQTPGAPPPPPPPPPIPNFMKAARVPADSDQGSAGPPAPPPPPPLPPNMAPFSPALPLSQSNSQPGTPVGQQSNDNSFVDRSTSFNDLTDNGSFGELLQNNSQISLIPHVRPKTKLKQMHWDKLDAIDKTFWSDIQHEELADKLVEKGVLKEVERAFVAKSSVIKLKKDVKSESGNSSKITFLPRDLAQQFGINLHMFANLSVDELILKIAHCHRDILDNISVLEFFNSDSLNEYSDTLTRNFLPYTTDFSKPDSKPSKPVEELDRPDRLYLEIFNMRHYWKSRSRSLLLVQTYQKEYMDLMKKLQVVDEANKSLSSSNSLRYVLGIIRSVGNFMNDFSKQALGFKLETLQRLKFMKDESNTMTFLHYVEKVIRNAFPEFGSFVDELSALTSINNIAIEQLENDCFDFEKVINNVSSSITKGNLSDNSYFHPEDRILSKITGPLENAKIKNALLQSHLKRTIEDHNALMEYFGENPKDSQSRNTFFSKFSVFVLEFKKAHVENIQREEDQRAYEARKRLIEERAIRQTRGGSPSKKSTTSSSKDSNRNKEALDDDDDDDDDEDEDDEDAEIAGDIGSAKTDKENAADSGSSSAVIDDLLDKLKSSGPAISTSSARERGRKHRRSKALSFYSTMSLDDLLEQVSGSNFHGRKGSNVNNINSATALALTKQQTSYNEYESVSSLKRRMTTRRKQQSQSPVDSESGIKPDQVMLRAQVMLNQLRSENKSNESIDSEDVGPNGSSLSLNEDKLLRLGLSSKNNSANTSKSEIEAEDESKEAKPDSESPSAEITTTPTD